MTTRAIGPAQGPPPVPVDLNLSASAQRLYDALQEAARAVAHHRGYHPSVTVVTLFCPVEAVALAIGVSRQTVYNRLPELISAGLVDQRGHYCTHRGQTRADGSLWAVRLNPDRSNTHARIEHDYLKGHYRDLGDDIAKGRTAWSLLQSNNQDKKPVGVESILVFAISPTPKKSITNDCKINERPELETLLDVAHAPEAARGEMVDRAAHAIGATLGTGVGSLNMWRWLCWQLLRLQQAQGRDYFYQVFMMIQRTGVDHREGACRNAGGLLVSRLKATQLWDDLRRVPHVRVGRLPS